MVRTRVRKRHLDNRDVVLLQVIKKGNASIKEMCSAILVKSTNSVASRLQWLEKEGYIVQPAHRQPRSRALTEEGERVLREMQGYGSTWERN